MKAVLTILALACSLAGCSASNDANSDQPSPVKLTATYTGGVCDYGGCFSTVTVTDDGEWTSKSGRGKHSGRLNDQQTKKLMEAVRDAKRSDLVSGPFKGTCPTAYDGGQVEYTLHRPAGRLTVNSCKDQLRGDAKLFTTFTAVRDYMND